MPTLPRAENSASFITLDDLVGELDESLTSSAALNAATAVEAGVPVVALVPSGKQPTHALGLGSRSQPFSRAEQVLDYEVEVLRTMGQRPNWGLLCGRGLAVLDFDGPEGRAWLDELAARHAEVSVWARSTLKVTTGRPDGGVHLYGAVPEGVDLLTASGAVAPHVDVRGAGFYVVGPGCRHVSGAFYRITTDLGYHRAAAEKDAGAVRDLFPVVEDEGVTMLSALTVPEVLLDLMSRPEDTSQGQRYGRHTLSATTADLRPGTTVPSAYVGRAVEGVLAELHELGKLGKDQRNDRGHGWDTGAFAAAVRLVELSNADPEGHPLDDMREQYLATCPQDRWFGSRQVEHKWASAIERVGERPAEITGTGTEEIESVTTTAEAEIVPEAAEATAREPVNCSAEAGRASTPAEEVRKAYPLANLAALVDPDRPERAWAWHGVVPEGEQVSIIAPAGEGKSLLVQALAVALALRRPKFIGRQLTFARSARVLIVDMENSDDDHAERLTDLGVTPENVERVSERLLLLSMPRLRGLDTDKGAEQLRAILDAYGIGRGDLLILDSTQRVTEGEENSSDTMRRLYNLTSAELKRRGLTVIRTDNTGWAGDRARGSSGKRDDVGGSWTLKRDEREREVFSLINTKQRSKGDGSTLTFRRSLDETGRLAFVPERSTFGAVTQDIRDLLDRLDVPTDAGARHARDVVMREKKRAEEMGEEFPSGVTGRLVEKVQRERGLIIETVEAGEAEEVEGW
ncbi:bifunctional DNA primase/polymerase [Brevibacterium casei]